MVGLVIVTHGQFGKYILEAAETILGPQKYCTHIAVEGSLEVESLMKALKKAVKEHETERGVLILTDMFGGTPSNLSLSLLQTGKIDVLTGLNLPMLLRILSMRQQEDDLHQLALEAKNAAIQGIVAAGEVLSRKIAGK